MGTMAGAVSVQMMQRFAQMSQPWLTSLSQHRMQSAREATSTVPKCGPYSRDLC